MFQVKINDDSVYKVEFLDSGNSTGVINNLKFNWDIVSLNNNEFNILAANKSYNARIVDFEKATKCLRIVINNSVFNIQVKDKFDMLIQDLGLSSLQESQTKEIKAPMPGLVLEILVKNGEEVVKGSSLLKLEAMKMENVIKSPAGGKIKKVLVNQKDVVEKNQTLIEFE